MSPPDVRPELRIDVGDRVATITLDRPATLNSLTFGIYAELSRLFHELASDETVRAVVLTGEGRGFCSGGDIDEIMRPLLEGDVESVQAFTRLTCEVVRRMRAMPQPIVAAVNGAAAGAGAVLALASDLRVVSEKARFHFLFTKVGLAGADMGAAWMLPRVIGAGRAAEALLFGEPIDAQSALAWGLANRVVAPEQVRPAAHAWARALADGPQEALRATKRALADESDMSLDAALDQEAAVQAVLLRGADHREFFDAYHAKRPPRWR